MNGTYIHKFKIVLLYVVVSLTVVLASCKKEPVNNANEKGSVAFSFLDNTENNLKSTFGDRIDSVDALVVSIKDQNDNYVYTNQVIKLVKLNGMFISSPLQLKTGSYKLSAFMLIDKNENVLFLTPMKGSKYAYLVKNPLEIEFSVVKNETTNITPEVISSKGHQPKDFGYAYFGFIQVKTFNLLLEVFSSMDSTAAFVNSYVTITHDMDTVFRDSLKAKPNVIRLPELPGDYKFTFTQSGFSDFSGIFMLDSLKTHTPGSHNPLVIVLTKGTLSGLVFWNTLGSFEEVTHSMVGPNLHYYDPAIDGGTDCCNGIGQPVYSPGKYGNAVSIGSSTDGERVHTIILTDASSILNNKHGCIELWYYQKEDPLSFSHGVYRLWNGPFGLNPYIQFYVADPTVLGTGLINFDIRVSLTETSFLKYNPGNNIRNNHNFNNRWIHLAAVWDIDGIDSTGNTMEIFVDGQMVAGHKQSTWSTTFGSIVEICGGMDYNLANKFYMDNLKVWNYAKTDFSDRFSE